MAMFSTISFPGVTDRVLTVRARVAGDRRCGTSGTRFGSLTTILVDNLGIEPTGSYAPLAEIAYCAEYVDTEMTPEYLYSDRYTLEEGSDFHTYSVGVVDHLRHQGHQVGPEMKAYYDAYISSLAHSPSPPAMLKSSGSRRWITNTFRRSTGMRCLE